MLHRRQELRRSTSSTSVSLKHTLPRQSPETLLSESLHCSEFPGAADDVSPPVLSFLLVFPLWLSPFLFSLTPSLSVDVSSILASRV